jgi:hypothetical protein
MTSRYEAGETQSTLEVIRNMARVLSVSTDALVHKSVLCDLPMTCGQE